MGDSNDKGKETIEDVISDTGGVAKTMEVNEVNGLDGNVRNDNELDFKVGVWNIRGLNTI